MTQCGFVVVPLEEFEKLRVVVAYKEKSENLWYLK